ncbi:Uncharacterised protein [Helicobacter fennelliae]|uniref:Uncharacterized protein n=1 Tax=Helicobacter fennelliae TaxID=215 RepID=A0A2X3GMP0_9HELI|nr:hypothetical protein [Helicobacter fennelliae]SQC36410.1 Uncharacterised protein [Helicobacter fennelliae]
MKRILLAILLSCEISMANTIEEKVFSNPNDKIINGGACSWECRDVKGDYATQIIGFDFKSGTTYCKAFQQDNLDQDLGIDASRINTACALKPNIESEYNQIIGGNASSYNSKRESSIAYVQNDKHINLTTFLTSLVTLNPNIIDREQTKLLGEIKLKNGLDFHSVQTITQGRMVEMSLLNPNWQGIKNNAQYIANTLKDSFSGEKPALSSHKTSYEKTSATDGFNKSNMAYFSDLFLANEKIYQHLQILLFVLVGGFFVTQIGANKLQAYLENRGESSAKEPYLHKFYIPLLMVGTFFIPIPEANGMAHSTIVQNVIRSFTMHSTSLADMANAIGAKTYMDKIYKNTGGLSAEGVAHLLISKEENKHTYNGAKGIFTNICEKRYERISQLNWQSFNFQTMSDDEKEKLREQYRRDMHQQALTKENISFDACINLQFQLYEAHRMIKKYETQIKGIKDFAPQVSERINRLDKYFANRNEQLGWIDSILIPSSAILAETFVFADDQKIKYDMEKSTKSNIKNNQKMLESGDVLAGNNDISDSNLGVLAGKLVWMMLPGASSIKDFVEDNITKLSAAIGGIIGVYGGPIGSIASGILGGIIGKLTSTISSYFITIYLIELTFEKVPLLVCTTASLVAFVAYLVSLCKYFYVSPFVVAFSLATKRMDKIIDFLISGISIFLKPVLIVLFIYLALFLHTLINELFIFLSVEQFSGIETSWYNFHTNFITGAITGLLMIFGTLASGYIMWKLIVSGPAWTLSLVGIDGKQDDVIASGIESNLAKRAFVA